MLRLRSTGAVRRAWATLPPVLGLALLLVQLTICPLPWFAALVILAGLAVVGSITIAHGGRSVVLANLAAAIAGLAAFEGYLAYNQSLGDGTRMEGTVETSTQPDDLLGYAPLKN